MNRKFVRRTFLALTFLSVVSRNSVGVEMPVAIDERLSIELVAQEPELNTPTGVAVDSRGRIWVIENNTHFTPKTYKGHASDRILIFDDFGPDGRARKSSTFADGFRDGMSIVFGKEDVVFFATRSAVMLLKRDAANADLAGERKTLVKLETEGNYPHNGLSGLAISPDGKLVFGLGENLGKPYAIVGSDGGRLTGGGEGGNVYRCELDGSKVERIATGFWNPWGLGFDAAGRLFCVENDPDSRPPCRLLHIVPGGDYGYKFRYGRKGIHPFIAWNGELPGTLPMVAGTGEAPCGVFACVSAAMPADYRDDLLVTSWGDNVIQRFKLKEEGASFKSIPEDVIKGGTNFRPVAIYPAPDGSLVISDWVNSSYPVHGKGRLWRIRMKTPGPSAAAAPAVLPAKAAVGALSEKELVDLLKPETAGERRLAAIWNLKEAASASSLVPVLSSPDPFIFCAAIDALARLADVDTLNKHAGDADARVRLGVLLALRKKNDPATRNTLPKWLADSDTAVRRAAVQWVGEEGLKEFAAPMEKVVDSPMTRDLFGAFLAAKSLLSGDKPDKGEYTESQMAQIFPSDKHPARFRAMALRNLRVDHPGMILPTLKETLASKDAELRGEAIRALALHTHAGAQEVLQELAGEAGLDGSLRATIVMGLARSAETPKTQDLLLALLNDGTPPEIQREAIRSLRGTAAQARVTEALAAFAKKIPALPAEWRVEMAEQVLFVLKQNAAAAPETQKELTALIGARPKSEAEWAALLTKPGLPASAAAGERTFYHARGAACFNCHRINARGGSIGPDLSTIGKSAVRERILQAVLEPSRDIAPEFVTWTFTLKDGKRVTGTIVSDNNRDVLVGESSGVVTKLRAENIERRIAQKGSAMPDELAEQLTQQEMRDLFAFLIESGAAEKK